MYSAIATYRFVIIGLATPEGIARMDANGGWVYDYYLKDHLGNVRAVITNEVAVVEEEIATIEWPLRSLENLGFDNIEETGENEPPGYPYDPNNPENAMVSSLSAALGDVIGPAKLMRVGEGTPIELDVQYWYTEYPGEPLTDVTEILAGVLLNLGTASTGLITSGVGEGMDLLNNVTTPQFNALHDFIENSFDTLNLSLPKAYLVYMYFSQDSLMVMPQYSGVVQVEDPDQLVNMGDISILPSVDGFLYTYVTNRSTGFVHFDNLSIRYWKPQVRVQYDYYPYGLLWENPAVTGEEALHDHCYQDKEFQFDEFSDGSGLALYDFHARMYDPATATWSVPDPAAQFANPYLAMGNNPVVGVDPDGEFVQFIIGAAVGAFAGAQYADATGATGWDRAKFILGGAAVGAVSAGIGTAVAGSGVVAANTLAISFASTANAVGMSALTQGNVNTSVSFGAVSFSSDGEIGYLGKKGNSTLENIGYGLGALANISDGVGIYDKTQAAKNQPSGLSKEELIEIHAKYNNSKFNKEWLRGEGNYAGTSPQGISPEEFLNAGIKKLSNDGLGDVFGGYNHDLVYYNSGTDGIRGVLFNTNVRQADWALARGMAKYIRQGGLVGDNLHAARLMRDAFTVISVYKAMIVHQYMYNSLWLNK